MMPAKSKGSFYQAWLKMQNWGLILISSLLSSAVVWAAASVANPVATPGVKPTPKVNAGGSMGESLLQTILGDNNALPPCRISAQQCPDPAGAMITGANQQAASVLLQPSGAKPVQMAQAKTFPDIQGNWARSFIEALAARDIIVGFPDGTFRPDEPVTRAQFAAMLRKAFPKDPIRPESQFVDVPPNYWGYKAIQEAYRAGFLEGYPNRVFLPNQNIPRVQVLVSLATGLNLSATAQPATILNNSFQDATQIPVYARDRIAAATENGIVVNYPSLAFLNPNQLSTRADVAAFIYQALVKAGQLPPLGPTDVATQYIFGYKPPVATKPPLTPQEEAALRQQLLLPEPPVVERLRRAIGGALTITTPTAYGADRFQGYAVFGYQERARNTDRSDGVLAFGVGVGDAQRYAGLEATAASYSTIRTGLFENYGISFKLHHLFPNDLAVAVGIENLILGGNPDPKYSSVYGVVSKIFPLGQRTEDFTPYISTSVGFGGGRFRTVSDINRGRDNVNVFGSVGVRFAEPLTLIGEYNQDLNLGLSIAPFRNIPLVITPAVADVTGRANNRPRFILGVGYGITF